MALSGGIPRRAVAAVAAAPREIGRGPQPAGAAVLCGGSGGHCGLPRARGHRTEADAHRRQPRHRCLGRGKESCLLSRSVAPVRADVLA